MHTTRVEAQDSISKFAAIQKLLYTRQEAAFALGLSVRAVDYLTASQQLATRRIGKRVLIVAESLRQFARTNHYDGITSMPPIPPTVQ